MNIDDNLGKTLTKLSQYVKKIMFLKLNRKKNIKDIKTTIKVKREYNKKTKNNKVQVEREVQKVVFPLCQWNFKTDHSGSDTKRSLLKKLK